MQRVLYWVFICTSLITFIFGLTANIAYSRFFLAINHYVFWSAWTDYKLWALLLMPILLLYLKKYKNLITFIILLTITLETAAFSTQGMHDAWDTDIGVIFTNLAAYAAGVMLIMGYIYFFYLGGCWTTRQIKKLRTIKFAKRL